MSSGCLSYLPISFHQVKCLVGGYVGNLYSNFNSSHYSPVPLLFTVIQNLLTAAAGCQASTGVLIISQSGVFYLPPSPLAASVGANGDVFLIKMRQGECGLLGGEAPERPESCAHWLEMHMTYLALAALSITPAPSHYCGSSLKLLNLCKNSKQKFIFHFPKKLGGSSGKLSAVFGVLELDQRIQWKFRALLWNTASAITLLIVVIARPSTKDSLSHKHTQAIRKT